MGKLAFTEFLLSDSTVLDTVQKIWREWCQKKKKGTNEGEIQGINRERKALGNFFSPLVFFLQGSS